MTHGSRDRYLHPRPNLAFQFRRSMESLTGWNAIILGEEKDGVRVEDGAAQRDATHRVTAAFHLFYKTRTCARSRELYTSRVSSAQTKVKRFKNEATRRGHSLVGHSSHSHRVLYFTAARARGNARPTV